MWVNVNTSNKNFKMKPSINSVRLTEVRNAAIQCSFIEYEKHQVIFSTPNEKCLGPPQETLFKLYPCEIKSKKEITHT